MSADNYTVCPRCAEKQRDEIATAKANLEKSYGKISAEEFRLAATAVDRIAIEPMPQNLREDYELGIDRDGDFACSFSCSCDVCGWHWSFKHRAEPNTSPRNKRAA
jgi:hypothetical protein